MNLFISKYYLIITFILTMSVSLDCSAAMSDISKQQTANIVADYSQNYGNSFKIFLNTLRQDKRYPHLQESITSYLANEALNDKTDSKIFRLLGIYARIKYRDAALVTLARLVEIPTGIVDGQAQHDNPQIKKIGKVIEEISTDFGLIYRNIDDRVF